MNRRTFFRATIAPVATAALAPLQRIAAGITRRREVFWQGYYWSVDAQLPNRLWFRLSSERSPWDLSFIDIGDVRITDLFAVHDLGDNRPRLHIEAFPESRSLFGETYDSWYVTPYGRPFERA